MKKVFWALGAIVLFAMGCSQPLDLPSAESKAFSAGDKAGLDALALRGRSLTPAANPVVKLNDGIWMVRPGYKYSSPEYAFWVDIQVQNLAYDKVIGIKWTRDHWATTQTAYAKFEASLTGGWERWGVDVSLPSSYWGGSSNDVEYAVFGTMNGQTYWDPRNNYFLGAMGNAQVKFLGGKTVKTSSGAAYEGLVRVTNLAYEKQVTVVYTTNAWATSATVRASYLTGNDWTFQVPLSLPNSVDLEFAVKYDVAGKTYWDNNGGTNYKFAIGPHITLDTRLNTNWLAGRELIMGWDANINGGEGVQVQATLNGQPQESQYNGSLKLVVDVPSFAPAPELNLEVKVVDGIGFTQKISKTYKATYNLEAKETLNADLLMWPYNLRQKAGKLYVADHEQAQILVRDLGNNSFQVYPAAVNGQDVDVDSQGNLVVLGSFYTPRIDIFNEAGLVKTLELPPATLNIPVAMEIHDDILYLGSYVEDKILKMDLNGNILGSISLPWFHKYKIYNGQLYVLVTYPTAKIQVLNLDGTFVKELPLTGAGFEEIEYPEDLTLGDGFIGLIQNYKVVVLDLEGKVLGKWAGRDYDYVDYAAAPVPGRFGSVVTSIEAYGREFYVGDFGAHTLHRFTLVSENQ